MSMCRCRCDGCLKGNHCGRPGQCAVVRLCWLVSYP